MMPENWHADSASGNRKTVGSPDADNRHPGEGRDPGQLENASKSAVQATPAPKPSLGMVSLLDTGFHRYDDLLTQKLAQPAGFLGRAIAAARGRCSRLPLARRVGID